MVVVGMMVGGEDVWVGEPNDKFQPVFRSSPIANEWMIPDLYV
jgi:hypothetical protein